MSSLTEQHLSAAFRDLVAEQPFTPDVSAIEHRVRRARRPDRITRGGIGAGVLAVAAVAAVGVASAAHPVVRAGHVHPARAGAEAAATGTAAQAPLVKLAAFLAAAPQPAGDATLVERETSEPGQASIGVWDLGERRGCADRGSRQPQVRSGVLRLVSALPGIAVTHGTADGQPTLTLTAGAAEVGDGDQEAITINADTGVPLQAASGAAGQAGTVSYVVTRVSLAAIAVGKF